MYLKQLEQLLALAREKGATDKSEVQLEGYYTKPISAIWLSTYENFREQKVIVIRSGTFPMPGDLKLGD